ncbi:MAG TPA: hypothetical protein DCR20_03305 [Planctomycetaceae bacterium]|nr:hypothetical protein [Planctomycetaceae bacterium]
MWLSGLRDCESVGCGLFAGVFSRGNCGKNKFWPVRTIGNSGFRPRLSFSVLNLRRPADTFPGSEFPEDFWEFCFLCTPPPGCGCACRSHCVLEFCRIFLILRRFEGGCERVVRSDFFCPAAKKTVF